MNMCREEFEAWVLSEAERTGYAYIDKVLSKFGESYTTTWVDSAWQGWKASRASLCVQMPRCWNDEQRDYRDNMLDSLDDEGVSHE